jgi:hypothetical protein
MEPGHGTKLRDSEAVSEEGGSARAAENTITAIKAIGTHLNFISYLLWWRSSIYS